MIETHLLYPLLVIALLIGVAIIFYYVGKLIKYLKKQKRIRDANRVRSSRRE